MPGIDPGSTTNLASGEVAEAEGVQPVEAEKDEEVEETESGHHSEPRR